MSTTPQPLKVCVQIVTWNSIRYIGDCLESLERQDFTDFSVVVVDNASSDGTINYIREHFPTVTVLQNFKNTGFAKANNQGIAWAKGEYVLVLNPDVIVEPDFLRRLISTADQHPAAGSICGKLYKLTTQAVDTEDESGLRSAVKTTYFDATGLEVYRSRRAVNRGEGQPDTGQYEKTEQVFGCSGACVLYRLAALHDTVINNEYFDTDFFAYKEDIDLAWRLRLYGWEAWYCPLAVAYHHRRFAVSSSRGLYRTRRMRSAISRQLRAASFKNHHLMLVKNEQLINIGMALPWLLAREIGLIGYSLIAEPFQWRSVVTFFQQLPSALRQRWIIKAHTKISPREVRKWFK